MMFWWLPWERLPAWILGPFLILAGGSLLYGEWPWSSWRHLEGGAFFIFGIFLFIQGLKTLISEIKDDTGPYEGTTRAYAQDMTPDFSRYTKTELRQILSRLDKELFPDRAKEVNDRLAAMSTSDREA